MIKSLNIDEHFTPTSYSTIKFTIKHFSGGEIHFKLDASEDFSGVDKVIIRIVSEAVMILEKYYSLKMHWNAKV